MRPRKERVFHDPAPPGAKKPVAPVTLAVAAGIVALVILVAATALSGMAGPDDGVAVEYADGTLSVRYAPTVPANQTILRVSEPVDSLMSSDRPLLERTYAGARAFNDTVDLRAHRARVFTVVIEEVDPGERRYHYWTFRDLGVAGLLGSR
jgi:hypothetical protein